MLSALEKGEQKIRVPGVMHKKEGTLHYTPASQDYFEKYIFPAILPPSLKESTIFNLISVEGCPYQCTFCNVTPIIKRKLRYRNLEQVIQEIKLVLEQTPNPPLFSFIDEAFVLNKERVLQFCSLLKEKNLKINWDCYGRINCMKPDLMLKMKEAGCVSIFYGIEAGSNNILTKIKKEFTIEAALRVAVESTNYFKRVTTSFIWGYPYETIHDFGRTLLAIRYLKQNGVATQLKLLSPVKGTELFDEYRESLIDAMDNEMPTEFYPITCEPVEIQDFIQDNKNLFLRYRAFPTPDRAKKLGLIESIGSIPIPLQG